MSTTVFKAPIVTLCAALSLVTLNANTAHADFLDDAKGKFSTSNIYFNRDFREGGADRKEWGQGFSSDWRSGFTQGPVGFGIDANAVLGVKLDSSPSRTGTGLLRQNSDGSVADEFSRIHITGKAKFSATEVRFGSHIPKLPVVSSSTSRLLPQVFEGTLLQSKEISGLTLTAARFSRVIQRDAVGTEAMALISSNSRYLANREADHLTLIGADWSFAPKQTLRYWAADFEDIYRQHFLGFNGSLPLGAGSLSADVRVFSSKDSGKALAGEVDNQALSSLFSYKIGAQKFGLGWQQMDGKTGFAHIRGADPYLINFLQIGNFGQAGERSWHVRYDLDFAGLSVPGLSFMTRYIQGNNARIPSRFAVYGTESESEHDVEMKYVVQNGPLKDLSVRLRNARYRSDFTRNADEIRLIIDYSIPF